MQFDIDIFCRAMYNNSIQNQNKEKIMASLSLRHIYKIYSGGVRAVSDFNLDIDDKEFIVFVGPSGCGKSTTLRMIAGLEDISSGELYIEDKLVNDVEPKDRDIAMVFQNYALYPHMTVYDNMAFGLRLRHVPAQVIDEKVQEAASILGIQHLLSRRPKALSGGQRQRVALGRAIVREPKVFLLDEPLSNLDAKLRVQMRTEITKIHHRLKTTFIYVTHDQTEAMTMGTRIVVMKDGIVQQVDTPTTLYDNPANLFVACFLGSPQMNIFKARLVEENGNVYALIGDTNKVMIPKSRAQRIIDKSVIGSEVLLGIRPEDVHYEQSLVETHPESVIDADVDVIENLGNETILYLNVDGKDDYTIARVNSRYAFTQGDHIKMCLATDHAHLFDPTTELTLMGVPDYNLIPAQLVAKDDGLVVMFGDTEIKLPESVAERLTDQGVINSRVSLGIPPKAFKSEDEHLRKVTKPAEYDESGAVVKEAEVVTDGVVDESEVLIGGMTQFYDNYPRFKAVYATVPGVENYIIVSRPLTEEFSCGDAINVYVNPADIQLFDEFGNPLIADKPVTHNDTVGTIVNAQDVYSYKFTGSDGTHAKLTHDNFVVEPDANGVKQRRGLEALPTATTDTPIYIKATGFTIDKDEIAKKPKMVLTGTIVNLDEYRKHAVLTVAVAGFNCKLTVLIRNFSGYNVGDKIKLGVDPASVVIGKPTTNEEAIKAAQEEGEVRYKELKAAREREKELEKASKKHNKETVATTDPVVEEKAAPETEEAPAATKKPAAKKAATEKKPPVKKPIAKKK